MSEPIIISSSSSQIGTTTTVLRHRLLETLGFFWTGTVSSLAASLEADRYLIASGLASDRADPSHLDGLYVWIRNGDQERTQRAVMNGAFDGPLGAFPVDYPYDDPIAVGTFFEVGVLPAEKYLGVEGANHCLNLALEKLAIIDYVPVTVVANQTQYPFSGYPWPIKGVGSVVYPRTSITADARVEMPRTWTFINDAESPILSFGSLPASAGDVIEVGLLRPAHTRIKTGGTWGDSTTGLVLEDDECLYDAATVIAQARPIALDRLARIRREGSQERADLMAEADVEHDRAAIVRWFASFRGNGRQSAGAGSTGRSWAKGWP